MMNRGLSDAPLAAGAARAAALGGFAAPAAGARLVHAPRAFRSPASPPRGRTAAILLTVSFTQTLA